MAWVIWAALPPLAVTMLAPTGALYVLLCHWWHAGHILDFHSARWFFLWFFQWHLGDVFGSIFRDNFWDIFGDIFCRNVLPDFLWSFFNLSQPIWKWAWPNWRIQIHSEIQLQIRIQQWKQIWIWSSFHQSWPIWVWARLDWRVQVGERQRRVRGDAGRMLAPPGGVGGNCCGRKPKPYFIFVMFVIFLHTGKIFGANCFNKKWVNRNKSGLFWRPQVK